MADHHCVPAKNRLFRWQTFQQSFAACLVFIGQSFDEKFQPRDFGFDGFRHETIPRCSAHVESRKPLWRGAGENLGSCALRGWIVSCFSRVIHARLRNNGRFTFIRQRFSSRHFFNAPASSVRLSISPACLLVFSMSAFATRRCVWPTTFSTSPGAFGRDRARASPRYSSK